MSPDAKALLERVRDAEDPTPDDERRVLAAVYGAAGAGALIGVGVGASKVGKLFAVFGGSGLKIGGLVLGLVVVGTAAWPALNPPPPSVLQPSLGLLSKTIAESVSAPATEPALRASAVDVRTTPSVPLRASLATSLRDELEFLANVQAALRSGDGATALNLLDRHETLDRQLLAERQAARVLALCAAGQTDEARVAGEAFLRQHSVSPQRSAVERSCAGEKSPGTR